MKHPYIDQLLDGTKPIEFRSRPTNIRGRIGLVAGGERGLIQGEIELYDCILGDPGTLGGRWHWHMRNPIRYVSPMHFYQPCGCVIWCNSHFAIPPDSIQSTRQFEELGAGHQLGVQANAFL